MIMLLQEGDEKHKSQLWIKTPKICAYNSQE